MTGYSAQKTEELLRAHTANLHCGFGGEPSWLTGMRAESAKHFAAVGIPTPRNEAWKYTHLRELIDGAFAPIDDASLDAGSGQEILAKFGLLTGEHEPRPIEIVVKNGQPLPFVGQDVTGLRILTLSRLAEEQPERLSTLLFSMAKPTGDAAGSLQSLNNALFTDGLFVELLPHSLVERPIHLVFCGTPVSGGGGDRLISPRVLVVAGSGSIGTLVESHVGLPGTERLWSNPVVECRVEDGAHLHHAKLQAEPVGCFHTALTEVMLHKRATYRNVVLTVGGGLVRNDVRVTITGPRAECGLYGATMAGGRQHVDHHTWIDHQAPESTSDELYRSVVDDKSRVVFNGAITVREHAQKTNARQTNNNLLLSRNAHIDTKPELLIYADDVKCAHGATVGELDELSRFYLRARGIPDEVARGLLLGAFLREAVDNIPRGAVLRAFHKHLAARLPGGGQGWEEQP